VSTANLWESIALVEAGHQVFVVTNADEVEDQYRTDSDLYQGLVPELEDLGLPMPLVIQTTSLRQRLHYIPFANPFVTKLAGLAYDVVDQHNIDLIIGHYLEPYGVAASLTASWSGVPFGLRHAGSDFGRLYHHDGVRQTFENISRSADFWFASGRVRRSLQNIGIRPEIFYELPAGVLPPTLFGRSGPKLPLDVLIEQSQRSLPFASDSGAVFDPGVPTVGIYGKIESAKGLSAMLATQASLIEGGHTLNLVVVGESRDDGAARLREQARQLGIGGHVFVLPFLPPWGVPAFLRSCNAIALLEHHSPIPLHRPILPREVLAVGTCLILSGELAQKQPYVDLLRDRENVVLADPSDARNLAQAVRFVIENTTRAAAIGEAGRLEISDSTENWSEFREQLSGVYARVKRDSKLRSLETLGTLVNAGLAELADGWPSPGDGPRFGEIQANVRGAFATALRPKRQQEILGALPLSSHLAPERVSLVFHQFYDGQLDRAEIEHDSVRMSVAFAEHLAADVRSGGDIFYLADVVRFEATRLELGAWGGTETLQKINETFVPSPGPDLETSMLLVAPRSRVMDFDFDVLKIEEQILNGETLASTENRVHTTVLFTSDAKTGIVRVREIDPACRWALNLLEAQWLTGAELKLAMATVDGHDMMEADVLERLWTAGAIVAIG
jgi:glycosyltransferase involved in cell wall biosynthesis